MTAIIDFSFSTIVVAAIVAMTVTLTLFGIGLAGLGTLFGFGLAGLGSMARRRGTVAWRASDRGDRNA